jgi:hypothetical protein
LKGIYIIIISVFAHVLQEYSIEQQSSFDKMLVSVYENVDNNYRLIGKALANAFSLGVFTSQANIQEIPLKHCKENNNKRHRRRHLKKYTKFNSSSNSKIGIYDFQMWKTCKLEG